MATLWALWSTVDNDILLQALLTFYNQGRLMAQVELTGMPYYGDVEPWREKSLNEVNLLRREEPERDENKKEKSSSICD
jgi:hypothetical protein